MRSLLKNLNIKKGGIKISHFFCLVFGVVFVSQVLDPTAVAYAAEDNALQSLASILSVVIQLFTALSLLIIQFSGDLLGTEMITGDRAMEAILPLWRFMRNVTYLGFVFALLFLSASNTFAAVSGGEGGGAWTIKEKLPKIIVAMIAVNFSLLMFVTVIDAVNVGTISILSISDKGIKEKNIGELLNVRSDGEGKSCEEGAEGCKKFYEWIDELLCQSNGDKSKGILCFESEDKLKDLSGISSQKKNIFLAFAVHFQHLEKLPALAAQLESMTAVVSNVLFSAVLGTAFLIALVAIFIALLSRVFVLWLAMIFSPVLVAGAILGAEGGGDFNIKEKIVTNLIMPLKIAAVLCLTFILISAMDTSSYVNEEGIIFLDPQGPLKQFVGDNVYGLMWKIGTVVIFWETAFWAIKGSLVAEMITDKIKAAGEAMGGYVATWGAEQIRMPAGAMEGVTLGSLRNIPSVMSTATSQVGKEGRESLEKFMGITNTGTSGLTSAVGGIKNRNKDDTEKLIKALETHDLGAIDLGVDKQKTVFQTMLNAKGFRKLQAAGTNAVVQREAIKKGLEDISDVDTAMLNRIGALKSGKAGGATAAGAAAGGAKETTPIILKQGGNIVEAEFSGEVMQEIAPRIQQETDAEVLAANLKRAGLGTTERGRFEEQSLQKVADQMLPQVNKGLENAGLSKMSATDLKKKLEDIWKWDKQQAQAGGAGGTPPGERLISAHLAESA